MRPLTSSQGLSALCRLSLMSGLKTINARMGVNSRTPPRRSGVVLDTGRVLRLQKDALMLRPGGGRGRSAMPRAASILDAKSVHDFSDPLDRIHDYTNFEPFPKSLIALPMSSPSSPRIRENRHFI